ncbi:MAG: endonuclease/exonuclease/phosphatase family protein [Actinobacteria bacterium]|nr:endonuclease/exonuclease/phosphatase family protein [Actinomycetota bacterium]
MRLATFNLLHGVPVSGGMGEPERDAQGRPIGLPPVSDDSALREAVALLDADVLGMQEVDVHQPRSGGAHQVRSAAEALGAAHWRFNPSVAGTPGVPGWVEATDAHMAAVNPAPAVAAGSTAAGMDDDSASSGPLYGVGLVSRLPVAEWRTTRFDPAPFSLPLLIPAEPRPQWVRVHDEPRAVVAAVVEGEHGPFTVATAHLSFVPGYNIRQLRALRTWLAGLPRPLVVLGDFNLPGRLPARITGWTPLLRQATYPSMKPRVQLDHVLVDGMSARQLASAAAQVRILPVSDHAAVTVDLDL